MVAALVNLVGSWIPYPWRDEAATWISTQRSLSQLGSMLTSVDAVHGVYYLGVRAWAGLFGNSVASLRVLSVLGVATAAALVTVLSHRLIPTVRPLVAGLICGLLPALTWAATEARSYSWVAATACAIVLAFVVAVERGGWRYWAVYAAALGFGVLLFAYLALLGVALLSSLPWCARTARRPAIVSSAAGVILGSPVLVMGAGQVGQVAWLMRFQPSLVGVGVEPFWGTTLPGQIIGGVVTVAVLIAAALAWREPELRRPLAILLSWWVTPSLILLAASVVKPLYFPRYVILSVPALALLLALLAGRLPSWWLRVLLAAALLAAMVPAGIAVRQPEAKRTSQPAIAVLENRAEPGDAVYIVGQDVGGLRWAFPDTFSKIKIIGQAKRGWRNRSLFQPSTWVKELGRELRGVHRLWLFADRGVLSNSVAEFKDHGFTEVEQIQAPDSYRTVLVLLRRS